MSKKWLWLTIPAVVLIAGCGGGGGGTPSQDFIVGTWEAYALSDSYSGAKVPVEEMGIFYTATFTTAGTWTDFGTMPGMPPHSGAGTWAKVGEEEYMLYEVGEDPVTWHREGSQIYEVGLVEGFGLLWIWLHKV